MTAFGPTTPLNFQTSPRKQPCLKKAYSDSSKKMLLYLGEQDKCQ